MRSHGWEGQSVSLPQLRVEAYNRLADAVEESVDWALIEQLMIKG